MPEIPLRTYIVQLDNLIERKQVDEVIAHCRHILSLYPKHLDTYRLLGKALLEKGRHGDAADIFERVLSVMPDDFISHVGMSIVREDEANLEAALWHMERAFEAAPSNGAIQQELCRLYGRRDGVAPSKARLTRGALARMYTQGGLYLQAEAELKAALTDEPERIDLLTVLAQVYWQTDQPAQAAQTSAAILQKLPYSLEANRILLSVFRAQGRPDDGAVYRQRLEAVDPYQAFADPAANGSGSARVDPDKVQVSRLDYIAGMEDSGSPDWLASIGARFEEPAATRGGEKQPDWLSAASEPPAQPAPVGVQTGSGDVPDWLKDLEPSAPVGENEPRPTKPADWLKDIDLGTTPVDTGAASQDEGLPDWLQTRTGPLPAEAAPSWMQAAPATATQKPGDADEAVTAPIGPDALPDWMRAAAGAAGMAEDTLVITPAGTRPPPAQQIDDMVKTSPLETPAEDELPDWLQAITAEPMPSGEAEPPATAMAPPAADAAMPAMAAATFEAPEPTSVPSVEEQPPLTAATIPAWLQSAAPEGMADTGDDSDVPDWLKTASVTETEDDSLPDWLRVATGVLDANKAMNLSAEMQASSPAEAHSAPIEARMGEATAVEEPAAWPGTSDSETLPPWLAVAAAAATGVAELASAAVTPSAPAEETLPFAAETAQAATAGAPDWMQPATSEANLAKTPAWMATAPSTPTLAETKPQTEPEVELPNWLADVAAGAPPPNAGQPADFAAGANDEWPRERAPIELPDFLQPASAEAIARAEQPYDFRADEDDMADSDDDSDLPLPADIPDWLKALAPVSPDPIEPEAQAMAPEAKAAPEPAVPAEEDSYSWLAALQAQAQPEEAAEPASTEVPAWLASAAAEPALDQAEDTLTASIPPWAEAAAPGPSDTIVSWLANRRVAEPPKAPESAAAATPAEPIEQAMPEAPAVTWPAEDVPAMAVEASIEPSPETAEASLEPATDIGSMDPDEAFRWLEGLAARQGANPDELLGEAGSAAEAVTPAAAEAPVAAEAASMAVESESAAGAEPLLTTMEAEVFAAEPAAAEAEPAGEYAGLPEWLRPEAATEAETAMSEETQPIAEAEAEAGFAEMPEWLRPEAEAALADEELAPAESEASNLPEWLRAAAASEPVAALAPEAEPEALAADETAEAAEAGRLPEWLREMEAAMPAEPLVDTAPARRRRDEQVVEQAEMTAADMAMAEIVTGEPPVEASAQAEPDAAAMEADEAMRWLEGLAAQQGANPDELFTEPEARPMAPPSWITAEQLQALEAEPAAPAETTAEEPEPAAMKADEAMHWLEGLVAQQAAAADEPSAAEQAMEQPAETPAEAPAWMTNAAVEDATASVEPSAMAEPEPAAAAELETPEWLKAYVPAEPEEPAEPAEPAKAAEPAAPQAPDSDKLARLSGRLAATRIAREQEIEARFAQQREEQETARRLVQERMEARWAAEAEEAAAQPQRSEAAPATPSPVEAAEAPEPAQPKPEPTPEAAPVLAGAELSEKLAAWTGRVEGGEDLPGVIRELERAASAEAAPVPVVQLLGDAYVRANHLQKALDTYRQALRRL